MNVVVLDKKMNEEVVLDLTITEELRLEGMTRELLRAVAELRAEANLKPKDKINLVIEAWPEFEKLILKNKEFALAVNAKVLIQKVEKVKLESRLDFGVDQRIIFGIR